MSRRALVVLHRAVCLTAACNAVPLHAQAPHPYRRAGAPAPETPASVPSQPTAPGLPATPAGRVLGAWLDAYNSPDTTRLGAFERRYQPGGNPDADLPPRAELAGLELLTVERSDPRRVEFTLRERDARERGTRARAAAAREVPDPRRGRTVYGVLEVSSAAGGAAGDSILDSVRVTAFPLRVVGPDVAPASLRIDAATRARVVAGIAAQLDTHYVFPDVARRMGDSLRARLARRAYDPYDNGVRFAARLLVDLRAVGRDKHLRVDYSPSPITPPSAPSAADLAGQRRWMVEDMNCGFVRAEQLEGNVGYLKLVGFAPPDVCAPSADAAMTFVAGTRALVVDLRENGGGDPAMVAYLTSYLFDRRTHLNDLWTRRTGATEQFWTRDSVPGRRFGGTKPVYVLTSPRTFSGGEEFAYNLQALKRATLVGETTAGGAHPTMGRLLDPHFMMGVPMARAVNPVTRTNWEGTGVGPDVRVPAADALAAALAAARQPRRASGSP